MVKSKKTISGIVLCVLMVLCLFLCVFSIAKTETAYASGESLTIADVLPDGFSETKETGWTNGNNSYIYSISDKFYVDNGEYQFELDKTATLTNSGTDYRYDYDVNTVFFFRMTEGEMTSFFVSCYSSSNFYGTYEPVPAPKVGDKFDDNGIKYEITSVGDTKTVRVGNNRSFEGTSVTIPATVIHKNVTFDVTEIGESAFEGCDNLISVNIPGSITRIYEAAFESCEELTSITIPGNVTKIDKWAFDSCDNLSAFICYAVNPPELGEEVFYEDKMPVIYVPATSVQAYKSAAGWSDFADKIEAIVTIADILPDHFPTSKEYAWKCTVGKNVKTAYINDDNLDIDADIPLDAVVEKDGDNYRYDRHYEFMEMPAVVCYTFNMTSGTFTSITVSGSFAGEYDGEYVPMYYFVNVTAGENGSVSPTCSENIEKNVAYTVNGNKLTIGETEITATAKEGYEFDCWKIGDNKVIANGTITAETTFTATFKVVEESIVEPDSTDAGDGLGTGAIVGIAVGSAAGVCLITYIVMFVVWKKKGKALGFLVKSFELINKVFKK